MPITKSILEDHKREINNRWRFESNAELSQFTTFQLGGSSYGIIHCSLPNEIKEAVTYLHNNKLPFILIGGGSNLVVSDQGLECFVIRYLSDSPLMDFGDQFVTVSGSTVLDQAVQECLNRGFSGINYCSGIPGTVGGAIVGNAGAFGKQIGDVVIDLELIDANGNIMTKSAEELDFAYRHSNLKNSGDIVISARLKITPFDKANLKAERNEILALRKEKHPDLNKYPCAGSFFRNIEPTSKADKRQAAGWFLEQAGAKKLTAGGAFIFEKHANIITRQDNASSQDIYDLSQKMSDLVSQVHGIELVREVRFVGAFSGHSPENSQFIW